MTEHTVAGSGPAPATVMVALEEVVDPELGLDIVSLGLVYDVRVHGTESRST